MLVSAFQIFAIAVLASSIIDVLGVSRTQIGLIGSINTAVGALTSPISGRLTDRIGPGRSVTFVVALGALGMGLMAWAPSVGWLWIAALVGGLPQGWGNPATNAYIAAHVPVGRRGPITGVKQSGVTLGVFASGALLPSMSTAWDWRIATWVSAAAFALCAVAIGVVVDRRAVTAAIAAPEHRDGTTRRQRPPIPSFVWPLTLYGLLMGTAGGAIGRFLPLFAEESAGVSVEAAGAVVAAAGLLGIVARLIASRQAEQRGNSDQLLIAFALLGAVYCLLLLLVTPDTKWLLFVTPPLNAVGIAAWNAVAMLAVITRSPPGRSGRASGIVMLGFLGGLTISGPTAGFVVDVGEDYGPVWIGATVCCACAAWIIARSRS